eukprot:COSAG02_NODE_1955_length_10267_cov_15.640736_1_plen_1378_part_00
MREQPELEPQLEPEPEAEIDGTDSEDEPRSLDPDELWGSGDKPPRFTRLCKGTDCMGNQALHLALMHNRESDDEPAANALKRILEAFGGACEQKNKYGRLPLHLALEHKAGRDILKQILDTNAAACTERDKDGRLPLHLALLYKADSDVLEWIVAANTDACCKRPERTRDLPLHLALRTNVEAPGLMRILEANRKACGEPDSEGRVPLHLAAMYNAPLDVVRCILHAHDEVLLEDPKAQKAGQKDHRGCSPLHLAAMYLAPITVVQELVDANPDMCKVSARLLHGEKKGSARAVPSQKKKKKNIVESEKLLPLHLAAVCNAPLEVVRCILDAHDEACLRLCNAPLEVVQYIREESKQACVSFDKKGGKRPVDLREPGKDKVLDLLREKSGLRVALERQDWDAIEKFNLATKEDCSKAIIAKQESPLTQDDMKFEKGDYPLHDVLKKRATPGAVQKVLEASTTTNQKDEEGRLPLHLALMHKASPDIVQQILKRNNDACRENIKNGRLPLHLAVEHFHKYVESESDCVKVVKAIIEAYPDACNKPDGEDRQPLHLATASKAPKAVVDCILQHANEDACQQKDNNGHRPLDIAVAEENSAPSDVVNLLREKSGLLVALQRQDWDAIETFDLATEEACSTRQEDGSFPLHAALHCAVDTKDFCDAVKKILERHPDACKVADNTQGDHQGSLPLHLALHYNARHNVVEQILERYPEACKTGVRADLPDRPDRSDLPLHIALKSDAATSTVQKILAQNREACKREDPDGCLPLHLALTRPSVALETQWTPTGELVDQILKEHPGACKVKTARDDLPLHLALQHPDMEISSVTRILEEHSTACSEKNVDGEIPLHLALNRKTNAKQELVELIFDHNKATSKFELDLDSWTNLVGQHLNIAKKLCELSFRSQDLGDSEAESLCVSLRDNAEGLVNLDLSHNKIKVIPQELCEIQTLQWLNLANNAIEELPLDLNYLSKLTELDISDNPALEHVALIHEQKGLHGTKQYIKDLHHGPRHNDSVKLFLCGPSQAGKSSLLLSLINNCPKLTTKEQRTIGLEIHRLQLGQIEFVAYDAGGHNEYMEAHQNVFTKDTLYLLLWNLKEEITDKMVDEQVRWSTLIQTCAPGSTVLPVGSHADEVEGGEDEADQRCRDMVTSLKKKLEEYEAKHKQELDSLSSMQDPNHVFAANRQNQLERVLNKPLQLDPDSVIAVSAKTGQGFDKLKDAMVAAVNDKDAFPTFGQRVPGTYDLIYEKLLRAHPKQASVTRNEMIASAKKHEAFDCENILIEVQNSPAGQWAANLHGATEGKEDEDTQPEPEMSTKDGGALTSQLARTHSSHYSPKRLRVDIQMPRKKEFVVMYASLQCFGQAAASPLVPECTRARAGS